MLKEGFKGNAAYDGFAIDLLKVSQYYHLISFAFLLILFDGIWEDILYLAVYTALRYCLPAELKIICST